MSRSNRLCILQRIDYASMDTRDGHQHFMSGSRGLGCETFRRKLSRHFQVVSMDGAKHPDQQGNQQDYYPRSMLKLSNRYNHQDQETDRRSNRIDDYRGEPVSAHIALDRCQPFLLMTYRATIARFSTMNFLFLQDSSSGFIRSSQTSPVHDHAGLRKSKGKENPQRIQRKHRLLFAFEDHN